MRVLKAIRTNSFLKRKAQAVERGFKRYATLIVFRLLTNGEEKDVTQLKGVNKILLVRPNFRIGNAIMSTPAILAFREKYPSATIDMLATDSTEALFKNLPVDNLHKLSRKAIVNPWKVIKLVYDLRKERYDLAVQLNAGSLSNFLFVKAVDARDSMGMPHKGKCLHDIRVPGKAKHAYDTAALFTRALGVSCRTLPVVRVTAEEQTLAKKALKELAETRARLITEEPFVALFVGGHLNKRCPLSYWVDLIKKLENAETPYIVFVGPEELAHCQRIEKEVGEMHYGAICRPRPLRELAAMLKQSCVLVTPDSGPMHMAAAVDIPTIAVVMTPRSQKFLPKGENDVALWELDVDQTLELIEAARSRQSESPSTPHVPYGLAGT